MSRAYAPRQRAFNVAHRYYDLLRALRPGLRARWLKEVEDGKVEYYELRRRKWMAEAEDNGAGRIAEIALVEATADAIKRKLSRGDSVDNAIAWLKKRLAAMVAELRFAAPAEDSRQN